MARRLSRRTFLRGAGGIAIGLPFLEAMAPRRARANDPEFPRRFAAFFTPNGTVPSAWMPPAGNAYELSEILSPLAAHKDHLLQISGLGMYSGGGDKKGHNRGIGCLLTGRPTIPGNDNGNDNALSYASGISLDQHLAQTVGRETAFASLEFGVQVYFSIPRGRMSYTGYNQPVPPEDNPWAMFNRVFGGFSGDDTEAAFQRARRGTILDAVQDDFATLNPTLGTSDRIKLESHLDAIREIEKRLDKLDGVGAACEVPDPGPSFNHKNNDRHGDVGAIQTELLVMAMACDLTRVATLMWDEALGNTIFTWLGHTEGHHSLSHQTGSPASVDQLVEINRWYAERYNDLLTRMSQIPEGDGTLLDHTVVMWGSEIGQGQPHYCTNIPFLLGGSCHGFFATGRHVAYDAVSHNNLLVTLLHAMGVDEDTFGDPAFCDGPLTELMA